VQRGLGGNLAGLCFVFNGIFLLVQDDACPIHFVKVDTFLFTVFVAMMFFIVCWSLYLD